MKSAIAHVVQGLFSCLFTRGHLEPRVTHKGTVLKNVSRRTLSRISPLPVHMQVKGPWQLPRDPGRRLSALVCITHLLIWKRTNCPRAQIASLHHHNTHTFTNHSQGVTLVQHSVFIKQVGRKDKRACFAYNMWEHSEQIPIYSLYLFEAKLTDYACCLQKQWELHSASVAV